MVTVNTREFDKAMAEYMKYTSRSLTEAVNQHAYYIARNATQTTYAADAGKIRQDLEKASKKYPSVPLAAILVNSQLGKKNTKGLSGAKMGQAVEKFIKTRISHRNFLRAGWIPAIKILANVVPKRGGSKIPRGTDKPGRNFGGAKAAVESPGWNAVARIWNAALLKGDDKSIKYVEEGAQKAMDMETESMRKYIEKKQEEAAKKFWK